MHDPHKFLFWPKCRPPILVSETKEPKKFFSIFREKSILKIEKKKFTEIFPFSKSNKSCLGEAKIFLKLFSKTKLACEQYENFFYFSTQLIWEILRSKVGKKKF
jgi:hypothetical protein